MLFFLKDLSRLLKQNENKKPCEIIAFLILLNRITLRTWTLLLALLLPPPLLLPPLPLILLQLHLLHLSARYWWFGPVSNSIACKVLLLLTYLPTLRLHDFWVPLIYFKIYFQSFPFEIFQSNSWLCQYFVDEVTDIFNSFDWKSHFVGHSET